MGVKKAAGKGAESSAVTCGKDRRIRDSGCSLIPPRFSEHFMLYVDDTRHNIKYPPNTGRVSMQGFGGLGSSGSCEVTGIPAIRCPQLDPCVFGVVRALPGLRV